MSRPTTLFCAGFGYRTRARDLAYEFERFGRLVRCDIPAPKSSSAKPYAFVEFEDSRDAEDAYYDMQGVRLDGYALTIQWAKQAPTRQWRHDDRDSRAPMRDDSRGRSRERVPEQRSDDRSRSPRQLRSLSPRKDQSISPERRNNEQDVPAPRAHSHDEPEPVAAAEPQADVAAPAPTESTESIPIEHSEAPRHEGGQDEPTEAPVNGDM
ncbi:hypothetical protein HDU98_005372 [Podochytrium sp. JEL0797]|nr:hypothetical protein HDU98_005372 [Podochytrium sp. JEL0797]